MKKREPGIDLIRCVGLLFVVSTHFFLKNGYYFETQAGIPMWLANSFRWLFYCCNGIFLLLTGYLKSTKPFTKGYYRSILPILAGYVLTCLFSFPVRHFLLGEELSMAEWFEKFISFANYSWYLEMYIGLFLFSPILNLALQNLKDDTQWLMIVGSMVFLTGLPSAFTPNFFPDYWKALYPMTYYILGAAIRHFQPKIKPWIALGLMALTALGLGAATILSTDGKVTDGFSQGYGGFWITAIGVFLFLGLYRLPIGNKWAKALAWLAGGCFEGYILSRLFDVWVYAQFPQWHSPEKYPIAYVCITIPIFIVSLLLGKAVHTLAEKLTAKKRTA